MEKFLLKFTENQQRRNLQFYSSVTCDRKAFFFYRQPHSAAPYPPMEVLRMLHKGQSTPPVKYTEDGIVYGEVEAEE